MVWASEGWGRTGSLSPPGSPNTFGLIQNFVNFNGGTYTIDGVTVGNNSTHTWSVVQLDSYTTQIEVRAGDVWSNSGGTYTDPSTSERCEISADVVQLSAGQLLSWEATVTVPAGPAILGQTLILQLHATPEGNTPCPVSIQIQATTEKLLIVGQQPLQTYFELYLSPSAIVRGTPMDIKVKTKMGATGNSGSVFITVNGATVVNNAALNLGAGSGSSYYWKWGIYREAASATYQIVHSHVHMYTG
jgi:hypothetical protein